MAQTEATPTGSQSDVARELGISRQAVSKLIKNRRRTGFPMPAKDGTYVISEVVEWYKTFDPHRGPKRGIRAEKVDKAA